MYERILIPLDMSAAAEAALGYAEALTASFGSSIFLVHVLTETDAAARAKAEAYLASIQERLGKRGIQAQTAVRAGEPVEEILRLAGEASATLLVMTSHGRAAHQVVLNATVAHGVLDRTHLPVLLVRPTEFRPVG